MAFIEKLLPLGQDGQYCPSRQGHAADLIPLGALKTSRNTCYNGHRNLRVRGGFIDSFHAPEDGNRIYHRNTYGAPDQFYSDVINYSDGIRGIGRFEHVRNDGAGQTDDPYLHYRYTIGATRDTEIDVFPETHTFSWRNAGVPEINQLAPPVLDRSVWPDPFSDVNIRSMERNRLWDYTTYPWIGGGKTYLLGTYGGHWKKPGEGVTPEPPDPWDTTAPGYPGGSNYTFDRPRLNSRCVQRRVLVWDPYWFEDWKDISPAIGDGAYDVGPYNWAWPFIWYWDRDYPERYYFEPCGAFLEEYYGSLFMFRTERTVMTSTGPEWRYDPDRVTWSRQGVPTALIQGTPDTWPFYVPYEYKRTWRDERDGPGNPQSAYFRPGRDGSICGAPKWGGKQWVVKPGGFAMINGTYHGNFTLEDLEATREGPAGRFAYCVTPQGIVYANPNGIKIFDGNPVGVYKNMANYRNMMKIFQEDVDWQSTADYLAGETYALSMVYDPLNQQIIASYPKVGEQGEATGEPGQAAYLPPGTPTHQFVVDMTDERFSEWDLRLTREDMTNPVGPGIMLAGREPVIDDNYVLGTAPIGGHGGRIFFELNRGHLDGATRKDTGVPDPDSGRTIAWEIETQDFKFNGLRPIDALEMHRSIIYVDDDRYDFDAVVAIIKKKITFDYHDEHTSDDAAPLDEPALEYRSVEDYMQEKPIINKAKRTGNNRGFMVSISFGFYNDLTVRDFPEKPENTVNKAPICPVVFIQHSIMIDAVEEGVGSKE